VTRFTASGRYRAPARRTPAILALVCGAFGLLAHCGSKAPYVDPQANVLLITLDTTRADYLGAYGNRSIETPNLDALAGEGVLFRQASASTPLTLPSHTTMMTGRFPVQHGVRDNGGFFLDSAETTLAEVLSKHGLNSFAILGAFVLHHMWGLDQGFATYNDEFGDFDPRADNPLHVQRSGAEVVRRAIDWWEAHPGERFFGWVHLYDPHTPHEPPPDLARRYPDDLYGAEIAYTDRLIGALLDYLKNHGLAENTLVIVAGDHGEGLGDHGEGEHGVFLYDSTMRVPLIVRTPGSAHRGTVDSLVGLVDLMPTVLDYLGIPLPEGVEGRSLLPLMRGESATPREIYAEAYYGRLHYGWSELISLREGHHKFIRAPRPELYDLREDPEENVNLFDIHPGIAEDLGIRLDEMIARGGRGAGAPQPEEMDPETMERLRSLGYVGSVAAVTEGELPDPKDRRASLELFTVVIHEAHTDLKELRFDEAIAKADRVLAEEPNFVDGYQIKAKALSRQGEFREAIETLEQALRLNPDHVETLHELARCHLGLGEHETVFALLDRIASLSREYPSAYFTRADTHVARDELGAAIAALEALLAISPESASAHYEIGRIHLQRGDLATARDRIDQALELNPELASAHYNLALIAEAEGDGARALREYEAEVDGFPENHEAWTNLGLLRMQIGDPAGAGQAFDRVIELSPELYLGHFLKARLLFARGRNDDEVRALARTAVELDPESEAARQLLAAISAAPR